MSQQENCSNSSIFMTFNCNENIIGLGWRIFIFILMLLITIGAIFGNILVITSIFRIPRLRSNVTNYFICSLAVADLLVALTAMPFFALRFAQCNCWHLGKFFCDLFNANDVMFSTSSIVHLCCISVDRYIAIIYPLHYERTMSRFRVCIMLILTWLYSIAISHVFVHTQIYISDFANKQFYKDEFYCDFHPNLWFGIFSSTVSFFLPTFFMCLTYGRIFQAARRQERNYCEHLGKENVQKREHKAAKTLAIIMGCFFICWFPFFVSYLNKSITGTADGSEMLDVTLFWIGYLNSTLNPIIYAFYNREFRHAFGQLLCKTCNKKQMPGYSSYPLPPRSDCLTPISRRGTNIQTTIISNNSSRPGSSSMLRKKMLTENNNKYAANEKEILSDGQAIIGRRLCQNNLDSPALAKKRDNNDFTESI